MKRKLSSFAFIFWGDKILLFLRDNNKSIPHPNTWALPGGQIEKGETKLQGLVRELREEVLYAPLKCEYMGKYKRSNGFAYFFACFVEDCEADKFKHNKGEGQKIQFFTLNQMKKINLTPKLKRLIFGNYSVFKKAQKNKSFKGLDPDLNI